MSIYGILNGNNSSCFGVEGQEFEGKLTTQSSLDEAWVILKFRIPLQLYSVLVQHTHLTEFGVPPSLIRLA